MKEQRQFDPIERRVLQSGRMSAEALRNLWPDGLPAQVRRSAERFYETADAGSRARDDRRRVTAVGRTALTQEEISAAFGRVRARVAQHRADRIVDIRIEEARRRVNQERLNLHRRWMFNAATL